MENKIQIKNNAFDYIRYYAALSVMLLHYTGYARIFSGAEPLFFPAYGALHYFSRASLYSFL